MDERGDDDGSAGPERPERGEGDESSDEADPPRQMDPLFEWAFRQSKAGTLVYLVVGLAVGYAVKWFGVTHNETPAWLWPLWVLVMVPITFSLVWWIGRWLKRRPPVDPAFHTSERHPDVDRER